MKIHTISKSALLFTRSVSFDTYRSVLTSNKDLLNNCTILIVLKKLGNRVQF